MEFNLSLACFPEVTEEEVAQLAELMTTLGPRYKAWLL